MKHKYTVDEVKEAVIQSKSLAGVLRILGVPQGGGSQARLKSIILENKIDVSHFTGQGWNKDNFNYSWMREGVEYHSRYRFSLINLRGRRCEGCGLEKWKNEPVVLEVHHIDGDRCNNLSENLELLCPNCHAYTENWRKKKNQ